MSPTRRQFMQQVAAAVTLPATVLVASPNPLNKHNECLTVKDECSGDANPFSALWSTERVIVSTEHRMVVGDSMSPARRAYLFKRAIENAQRPFIVALKRSHLKHPFSYANLHLSWTYRSGCRVYRSKYCDQPLGTYYKGYSMNRQ